MNAHAPTSDDDFEVESEFEDDIRYQTEEHLSQYVTQIVDELHPDGDAEECRHCNDPFTGPAEQLADYVATKLSDHRRALIDLHRHDATTAPVEG